MGSSYKNLILGIHFATLVCLVNAARLPPANFHVVNFGAKGDGATDDSPAFFKAWNATCNSDQGNPTMIIPIGKTFLLNPTVFNGPCKAPNTFVQILGNIVAPAKTSAWKGLDSSQWLAFKGVTGLRVSGTGQLNGQGQVWWAQSCRYHPGAGCTKLAPTSLKFLSCNNTELSGVHFVTSPQTHVLLMGSYGMNIQNIYINSSGDSPNTDGIHIQFAGNITINNTEIQSGDDCVSSGDYTSNVTITNVNCGPGHGISIGSLGASGNFVQVEDIHVYNVSFFNTTNGVRIKTYQVGTGYCKGVTFQKLNFTLVQNPIIIDQYYCAVAGTCKAMKTGVQISNVTYQDLVGTTTSEMAINLNCSQAVACTGLTFNSIQLTSATAGQLLGSNCINSHGNTLGMVKPDLSCLLKDQ